MSRKSQRSGRKDSVERIRELVALLGALGRTGDTVSLDAISARMGISMREASDLMDIVCGASGEETSGLLISSNEDGTEFTLQYPGVRGRPLRLTEAETYALMHALDLVGVDVHDPLRVTLREAYMSPEVKANEVRRALGFQSGDRTLELLAEAQADSRSVHFLYMGLRDSAPRERRCMVRRVNYVNPVWYVRAYDLDLGEDRIFRSDRMSDVSLGHTHRIPSEQEEKYERVTITFYDKMYYNLFEWPGLRVIREYPDRIVCDIPYYGESSMWLARRVAACGGTAVVDNDRIMGNAQYYASSELV